MARKHAKSIPLHERYQTKKTREGERNMVNRKPFRTKHQKAEARIMAKKAPTGQWKAPVAVSKHLN